MIEKKNSVKRHQAARLLSIILALCLLLPGNIFQGFNFKVDAADPSDELIGAVIKATKYIELDPEKYGSFDDYGFIIPEKEFTIRLEQVNQNGDALVSPEIDPIYTTISTKNVVVKKVNDKIKIAIDFDIVIPKFMTVTQQDEYKSYFFKITEVPDEDWECDGEFWEHDDEHYFVTSIVIWLNGEGQLEVQEGYVYDSEWDESKSPVIHKPIVFTNTYKGPKIQARVKIKKNIIGKPNTDDKFTFKLEQGKLDDDGLWVFTPGDYDSTITIAGVPEGGVNFSFEIKGLENDPEFDTMYFFMVTEESGEENPEWRYYGHPYIIAISVSREGNNVEVLYPFADSVWDPENGQYGVDSGPGPLVFENVYPARARIEIKKKLENRSIWNEEFEFKVETLNSNGDVIDDPQYISIKRPIPFGGKSELLVMSDLDPDTTYYYYRVTEIPPPNWTCVTPETLSYLVTVKVYDDGKVTYSYYIDDVYQNELDSCVLEFVNDYTPPQPVPAKITVKKTLNGGKIEKDEIFTFTLEEMISIETEKVNENVAPRRIEIEWSPDDDYDEIEEKFEMDLIPGTYYYKITEEAKTQWACAKLSYFVTVIVEGTDVIYKIDKSDEELDTCELPFLNTYIEYDVALKKWVYQVERGSEKLQIGPTYSEPIAPIPAPIPMVRIGDKVTFAIRVYNQTKNTTWVTRLIDYIPAGYTFNTADNPDWKILNADDDPRVDRVLYKKPILLQGTPEYKPANGLSQYTAVLGNSATIYIVLTVSDKATAINLRNWAEVIDINEDVEDPDPDNKYGGRKWGNKVRDRDSYREDEEYEDPDEPSPKDDEEDNEIDELWKKPHDKENKPDRPNRKGDKDDYDYAEVELEKGTLTLKKKVTDRPNDDTKFYFTVKFRDGNNEPVPGIIMNVDEVYNELLGDVSVSTKSSVTFSNIPAGTKYEITEVDVPTLKDYKFVQFEDADGKTLTSAGKTFTGTVAGDEEFIVVAVNKYDPESPENPGNPGEPGEPEEPEEPEGSTDPTTTAPPETTTAPPETTTAPQETTNPPPTAPSQPPIPPPATTNPPPEQTTAPPEQTTAPTEPTTAPPDSTSPPPETTTTPGEPPVEPPPETPPETPPYSPPPETPPTQPPIEEPTTAPPTSPPKTPPPQPPIPSGLKPYEPDDLEDLKDNSTPLINGWFAVELEDDWWEIFDENGKTIGVIYLPGGINDYDVDYIKDNIKPLPKPNPPTGDSAVTIFVLLAITAAAATVIFKKRRKVYDLLHK